MSIVECGPVVPHRPMRSKMNAMPGRRHSAVGVQARGRPRGAARRRIVDELRRVILDGGVPPGTPIPVSEVAEVFGVSPIPVRESLKTLTGEGLVAHQPNVGYAVAQLTASELAEMYIVRETLESAALAAAVAHATDADRAHVAATNRLLEDAVAEDDPQAYHRQSRHLPHGPDPAVGHAPPGAHARIRLEHHRTRAGDGARRTRRPRAPARGPRARCSTRSSTATSSALLTIQRRTPPRLNDGRRHPAADTDYPATESADE